MMPIKSIWIHLLRKIPFQCEQIYWQKITFCLLSSECISFEKFLVQLLYCSFLMKVAFDKFFILNAGLGVRRRSQCKPDFDD